jgi:hypothetical protein
MLANTHSTRKLRNLPNCNPKEVHPAPSWNIPRCTRYISIQSPWTEYYIAWRVVLFVSYRQPLNGSWLHSRSKSRFSWVLHFTCSTEVRGPFNGRTKHAVLLPITWHKPVSIHGRQALPKKHSDFTLVNSAVESKFFYPYFVIAMSGRLI